MLISHAHRFIYTKTFKTAGTSVESYFERFCMPAKDWQFQHARDEHVSAFGIIGFRGNRNRQSKECKWWNHMPAALVKESIGPKLWGDYFKFCVVRNPYDRAVSHFYFDKTADSRMNGVQIELGGLDRDRNEFEIWLRSGRFRSDRHAYVIAGDFCLDDVIRYERLHDDTGRICGLIGVPYEPEFLPRLKAGIRPEYGDAKTFYTEESRRMVEAVSRFEIEHFGYSFPAGDIAS